MSIFKIEKQIIKENVRIDCVFVLEPKLIAIPS
jgi:hypothetical protein